MSVNVPTNINTDAAVTLYYTRNELSTSDIMGIFDCSETTARGLKKAARAVQDQKQVPSYNARAVNVQVAYEVWGLDIKKLERAQNHPKIRLGAATE